MSYLSDLEKSYDKLKIQLYLIQDILHINFISVKTNS